MLKIKRVLSSSFEGEEENTIMKGPDSYFLELEDEASNEYLISVNKDTYVVLGSLLEIIEENTQLIGEE